MNESHSVDDVSSFWNAASCGEKLYLNSEKRISYELQLIKRYLLEPEIISFADFEKQEGRMVLEIGVGLGADHQMFAESGAILYGIDLTPRAIKHVRNRFDLFGLKSDLQVANAEKLRFKDSFFDFIYSWGVIHHSPDTVAIVSEIYRTLKPGGSAKIMIYHKYSLVGFMLWVRYGLLRLKPWLPLRAIYANYLESFGTKAYSKKEAKQLFSMFNEVQIKTVLSHADLLVSDVGQRHRGLILSLAKSTWPRWFFRIFFKHCGLFMMIDAVK